jgi:hypothetical protein
LTRDAAGRGRLKSVPVAGVPVSDERLDSDRGIDRRRVVAGGLGIVFAILGYAATQAVVAAASLPDDWVLIALPVFGVAGVVGLAAFVTGALAGTAPRG